MMKRISILFLLLWSFKVSAFADITMQDIYKDYPASIDTIYMCGKWNDGKLEGQYKIIQVLLYGNTIIFIDIITTDYRIASHKSLKTISIKEFNNNHSDVSLENIQCNQFRTGIKIIATAIYGHEERISRKIEIILKGNSNIYELQEEKKNLR